MRKQAEIDSVVKDEQMHLIQDLQDFIKSQPTTITEFDETLVKRLITKITVYEDHFTIDFKSGVTIDIEAKTRLPAVDDGSVGALVCFIG